VSKENRASTSVDTLPGTILRISLPNATRSRSNVASTLSSRSLPYRIFSMLWSCVGIVSYMIFAIVHSFVDQLCVLWFLRSGKDEGRVGGSILGLVFCNGCRGSSAAIVGTVLGASLTCKVTGVAHDCLLKGKEVSLRSTA
jgi:hypothetical protein